MTRSPDFPPGHSLNASLTEVLSEIRLAEEEAGRAAGSVRLIVVSKGQSLETIREKIVAPGLLAPPLPLAENRGQELRDKVRGVAGTAEDWPKLEWPRLEWHFIGPLQRNKIKYLKEVSLIHTLENAEQVRALAAAAGGWGHAPEVLVQLHNGEAQKHGVLAAEVPALCREAKDAGLTVRGLMVMAPYGDPAAAQQVFEGASRLAQSLSLPELSMGMSDDFLQAIAAGATLVRIGRRLFA